jgi:hypothetical protein
VLPEREVCPLCVRDDLVTVETLAQGAWRYMCSNTKAHDGAPYVWEDSAAAQKDKDVVEGKAVELGLLEDLMLCLEPAKPPVEYGIVEYRYSRLRPETFHGLLDDYGHTRIERNKPYTVSSFIAGTLGRLAGFGELDLVYGPATGHWAYNEVISYWSLPHTEPQDPNLSWEQFAGETGIDPLLWDLEPGDGPAA